MSSQNNRRTDPGGLSGETVLGIIVLCFIFVGGGALYAAVYLGHKIAGTADAVPANPIDLLLEFVSGRLPWPGTPGWVVVAALTLLAVAVTVGIFWVRSKLARGRSRVDSAASYMGRGKDIESLSKKHVRATARRLGVAGTDGVPIGRAVNGGQPLYGSWEDMHVDIWGPRTGKTTSRAVPAILDAPGAVIVTSNKRDVVDATRDVRAKRGPVWVFDPQQITLEEPTWWWDPLSYVTDEVKAAKLAEHFSAGSSAPGAKTDAYFTPAGEDLLAGLLYAAALDGRPITDVYGWITRPTNDEPARILRAHGVTLLADQVAGVISAPEKQRGGVYGTAQQMASCLTNRQISSWITRQGGTDMRPTLDVHKFVRTEGTLYSLSKEGKGTAGPLVTALTVALVEAAEELAAQSPGGRLTTPLVGVLDEAANVCRWRELPSLYSHYGSRGIVLMTILQSWSQGVDVWGESGMKKLWSASNVKVYGGGVAERGFLEDLSHMIGDFDRVASSTSYGRGHRSVSQQLHRERILDVSDLGAIPKGRAVVLASGSRPTMIRTQPWMAGPHAEAVRASIRAHDPQGGRTIAEAERERAAVASHLGPEGSHE